MESPKHDRTTSEFFSTWAASGQGHSMASGHAELVAGLLETIDVQGKAVLDVGCGVGEALATAKARSASQLAGIDLSEAMINIARDRLPEADLHTGSVEQLPWPDNTFDFVISIEAMYYFHDPVAALKEIRRVLKPGGSFSSAIEYYQENTGSLSWASALPMNVWCWTVQEWQAAFEQAGFRNVQNKRIIRKSCKSKREFQPSRFFPDYDSYLTYIRQGALLLSGQKI